MNPHYVALGWFAGCVVVSIFLLGNSVRSLGLSWWSIPIVLVAGIIPISVMLWILLSRMTWK